VKGLLWLGLMALALLMGSGTVFVSVVTAVQALQEKAQARWPVVTAHVDACDLAMSSAGPRRYYIGCRLGYEVGAEEHEAHFYSRGVPPADVWQSPPNQIAPLEVWLQGHPSGTPIELRYDPADHGKAVIASDYLPPFGGPHTPRNLKLLAACAASFVALLACARPIRPRSDWRGDISPDQELSRG
jgi:hypothetical protein